MGIDFSIIRKQRKMGLKILQDGSRVYRFYSRESKMLLVVDYIYTDVSVYDYLKRLETVGKNLEEYRSIWYYF